MKKIDHNLNKLAKNLAKLLFNRYRRVYDYDVEDFNQECLIIAYQNRGQTNEYICKACFNHFSTLIKKQKELTLNNKDAKIYENNNRINDERFFNIKIFLDKLPKSDIDMIKSLLYDGRVGGKTSYKYKVFEKLRANLDKEFNE